MTIKSLERQGQKIDAEELGRLRDQVRSDYDAADRRSLCRRPRLDRQVIDPAQTRDELVFALEIATRHAELEPFRLGVFQV